jgi:hypothetical protein
MYLQSNKQKKFFVGVLKVNDENRMIRIYKSEARIRTKKSRIRNNGYTDMMCIRSFWIRFILPTF